MRTGNEGSSIPASSAATTSNALARVEHDNRPSIIQRWVSVTTSPSGMTQRKRHLSRKTAITTAALYLSIHDDRRIQASAAYDRVRRQIVAEYEAALDKEAPSD